MLENHERGRIVDLVLLNWSEKAIGYTIPGDVKPGRPVLSNVQGNPEADGQNVTLAGWEARVYTYWECEPIA